MKSPGSGRMTGEDCDDQWDCIVTAVVGYNRIITVDYYDKDDVILQFVIRCFEDSSWLRVHTVCWTSRIVFAAFRRFVFAVMRPRLVGWLKKVWCCW